MRRAGMRRVGFAVVRGRSMLPTLQDGDRLLVLHGGRPRVGRLVVVRLPTGVVAVKRTSRRETGGWWVERDNRAEGVDSWSVGAIADADVIAVVLCRVWPPRALCHLHHTWRRTRRRRRTGVPD